MNIEKIFDELYPICRSITGQGFRDSFQIIKRFLPFKKYRYPTGKKVFDWTVPSEWNIQEAYIENSSKKKIIDFKKNNLHVLNYSTPINKTMSLEMLNKNLHSIPNQPNDIPYVTSYYKKNWGFCLAHKQRINLPEGLYKVVINSSLKKGFVEWGEYLLKKTINDKSLSKDTILITSYLCHPSMANNELSGPINLILLYNIIKRWKKRRFNYLFLLNPETIGSICFIHKNLNYLKRKIIGGLVLTCLGGPKRKLTYKLSKSGIGIYDHYFSYKDKNEINVKNFYINGSDERQFCSSELNLPIGQISKTTYGEYKEYHTSADNKKFVKLENFNSTAKLIAKFFQDNEKKVIVKRKQPNCEIQLGKRGLYPNINSVNTRLKSSDKAEDNAKQKKIIKELLSYADGVRSIYEIPCSKYFTQKDILRAYKKLKKKNLFF